MEEYEFPLVMGLLYRYMSIIVAAIAPIITVYGQQSAPTGFVKVVTLNSIEANQNFQKDVQIVQTQRLQAAQLQQLMNNEQDAAKKAELQKTLDILIEKLNENNQKMLETYRFTLNRNYTIQPEVVHILMEVSEEEAAQYEAAAKKKEQAAQ